MNVDELPGAWYSFFRFLMPQQTKPPFPSRRRPLTDEDRLGWDMALDVRGMDAPQATPKSLKDAAEIIRKRDRLRWWYCKRDFAYLQKQMKSLGLNPEDARFLL